MDAQYPMISALQHLDFCPRQCALIHLEQQWAENRLTIQGENLHERVDSGAQESRQDIYTARTLRIISHLHQITGIADLVEFYKDPAGIVLPNKNGLWRACPVEYKRGKSKMEDCDRIQLCAQALCLEEMLRCQIPKAALYYGLTKHREWVDLDQDLRDKTIVKINELHALLQSAQTPAPVYMSKCKNCSMIELCQPKQINSSKAEKMYRQLFVPEPL